jgi:uncharacterized protein
LHSTTICVYSLITPLKNLSTVILSINYVCRKCGKAHSKKEFDESQFCKTCNSFLLPKFTANYSMGSNQKHNRGLPVSEGETIRNNDSQKEKSAILKAAESLRQRAKDAKEFQIFSETENKTEQTKSFAVQNWMWNSEYEDALQLKQELIRKHKGESLEKAIPGEVLTNEQGQCYSISETCTANFKGISYEESRRVIISDLKVLAGVGPVREKALKELGYATVERLQSHPVWNKPAQEFMKIINAKKVELVQNWLWQRLSKSNPLLHYLAGFCEQNDFAIVDIETLGLSERPIILLGIAKPNRNNICINQYLLRDIQDEPSAIWSLVSQLEPSSSLITFNGKGFDIPYIRQRLAYYGMAASLNNPHFDILHFTRRALRHKLPNCRLETVEKYLGINRDINIPGALVPDFYDTYLRTRNVGPLVAIVEHNKQDLLTLGTLFSKLYEEWNL